MNEHVSDVVDRFRRLPPDEQTQAYLEIETIWKAQPDVIENRTEPDPLRD